MINKLSEDEARALLRESRTGRLGCISEGEPYVVPINYVFDGECVLVHALPGRKIEAMRASPRVCLQVDDITDPLHWRSVLASGAYEEVSNQAERAKALYKLLVNFPHLTPVESRMADDAASPPFIVFRIRIDRLTGVGEGEGSAPQFYSESEAPPSPLR